MEKILLEIALILIATKIGGMISRKLKMPEVLGALVAGIIIGPMVFNLVQYDDNIKLLSNLGVILLMFLAGLETNADEFKKSGKSAFVIALLGIVLPLILGTLSAFLFFGNVIENIFVGVILTATSVSISVETLSELGKLNSRAGINILGAAVIDDILGLVLISILLAFSGNIGDASASTSFVLTIIKIGFFCIFGVLGIIYIPKFINRITKDIEASRTLLTFAIAAALIIAAIAEYLGIAAITGAYLCGLILSQFIHKEYLVRNVKAISSGFLSPIFFASVGIEANLNGIDTKAIFITLVMFIVAVIGKVVGCGYAARLFKMSPKESLQVGIGMISRGEVAIITANIGLQKNIISQEVFIPTLIVVILTTVVTPVLLKLAFMNKSKKKRLKA